MFVKLFSTINKVYLYFFCTIFLTSCATIFSGTTQNVRLRSSPGNAKVFVNGEDSGNYTTAKIKIKRAVARSAHNDINEQVYLFQKEGYEDLIIKDKRTVNGLALALDIIIWPALIVDFLNGSIYKYRKRIDVQLTKKVEKYDEPIQDIVKQNENTNISIEEEPKVISYNNEESIDVNIPESDRVNSDAIAILIGNEIYSSPDINNVTYASEDVETMKKYLIKTFGFREGNVITINNATLADFNRTFGNKQNFRARLYNLVKPEKSDVFVYYTGHGAPSLVNKEGYLVPVECQDISLLQFEGYSLNTLFDNISNIPYKSLTVVLDACFSGNTHNGALIKNASPVYIAPRLKLLNKENTVLFSSSMGDQISSWYPEKEHSLFTYYFLKGIKDKMNGSKEFEDFRNSNKSNISIVELNQYLQEEVPYQARFLFNRVQNPEVLGDKSGNLIK